MYRFIFRVLFLFFLAWRLFFPFTLNAQNSVGSADGMTDGKADNWALPEDRIMESEGRGLIVRSNPSGARVYIDGIERGRTPLYLENLRAGFYYVRVEKEAYSERRFRVSVRQGSVLDVSVELKEAVGRILLNIQGAEGSPGLETLPLDPRISVDGYSYPQNHLELPVGFRNVLVRAFGWEDATATVYVEEDSFKELELFMKPAAFKVSGGSQSRSRFNPANAGSLGTVTVNFNVASPGKATLTVMDPDWKVVYAHSFGPFETWSQSVIWNGRDNRGEILPDGIYTLIVSALSLPWDGSAPVEDGFVLKTELDSTRIIQPLNLSSGKSGLLYSPLPALLPPGSFQIEGSLLAGDPPAAGGLWTSLPFSVAARISPLEKLEVSAALNVVPRFKRNTGTGIGAAAKWVFLNPNNGPLGSAAGLVLSWTGKTGLSPFGMASGIEAFFPLSVNLARLLTLALTPAALWTGDEGFPWEPAPRLLVSGGILLQLTYVTMGLSIRQEYKFSGGRPWPPPIIAGAEIKIFPLPSSFVFSLMGGIWAGDNSADSSGGIGGFAGLGIGMIY